MRIILSILLVFVGCAAGNISSTRDDFEQCTRHEMQIALPTGILGVTHIYMKTVCLQYDDGHSDYGLRMIYNRPTWNPVTEGESAVFLLDGKRIGIAADNVLNHQDTDGYSIRATEGFYTVDATFLTELGNAKSVRVKLVGQDSNFEGELSPENLGNIRTFIARFVTGSVSN